MKIPYTKQLKEVHPASIGKVSNIELGVWAEVEENVIQMWIPYLWEMTDNSIMGPKGLQPFFFGNISLGGSRASNCTNPSDNLHGCWNPLIDGDRVGSRSVTIVTGCGAGRGSIQGKEYHAAVQNNQFIIDSATEIFLNRYEEV